MDVRAVVDVADVPALAARSGVAGATTAAPRTHRCRRSHSSPRLCRDVRDQSVWGRCAHVPLTPGSPGTTSPRRPHPDRAGVASPCRAGTRSDVRGRRRTARASAALGTVHDFTGRRSNRPAIERTTSHERSIQGIEVKRVTWHYRVSAFGAGFVYRDRIISVCYNVHAFF